MSNEPMNDTDTESASEDQAEPAPSPSPVPVLNPEDPMAIAASRAVDGKVAVIERGSGEAKIVEMPKPDGGNGIGEPKASEGPKAPEPIQVDETDAETIRESLQALRGIDANISHLRVQYLEQEQKLLEQLKDAKADLNSTIKTIGKRQKVPQDWMLNADNMCFEPPKRQAFPFARR